ncbi:hypothetical protein [Vibrio parahaemolyticus]|uniref:hypothetical protein n=1 Tax=Vibrio parahaemolyticus TaxID=670 RepID=UPI0032983CBB
MKLGRLFSVKSKKSAEQGVLEQAILDLVDGTRKREEPAIGLSMLDIMACGLGGVAFLAVLQMLIRIPLPPPLSQNYILAEIAADGLGQIGFLVKPPETDRWFSIIPDDGNKRLGQKDALLGGEGIYASSITYSQTYSYQKCDADTDTPKSPCRSVAYLHIEAPSLKEWKIRPYFYQYRNITIGDGVDDFQLQVLSNLSCTYWSRDRNKSLFEGSPEGKCAAENQLNHPGDLAEIAPIQVVGP